VGLRLRQVLLENLPEEAPGKQGQGKVLNSSSNEG
jgi:hypothetical protein